MNMGVIIQSPRMRMQNSGHTDDGTQVFGICAKIFQSARSTFKHKFVNELLVIEGQASELIGKRKGYQKVGNR